MTNLYALPVSKAIVKVERHGQRVVRELSRTHPRVPLHEVPWSAMLAVTSRVLSSHADFKPISTGKLSPVLRPIKNGKEMFAHYEIGNYLFVERVVRQLTAEGVLKPKHVALFKKAVGELHHCPPRSFQQDRITHFFTLVEKIGRKRAEKLIKRAQVVWQEHARGLRRAIDALEPEQARRLAIGDMFSNPSMHVAFNPVARRRSQTKGENVLLDYVTALSRSSSTRSGESYYMEN